MYVLAKRVAFAAVKLQMTFFVMRVFPGLVQQYRVECGPHDLPAVQAGCGALRVQQAATLQVHCAHGSPVLEPGTQPPHPWCHAVQPSQVSGTPCMQVTTNWEGWNFTLGGEKFPCWEKSGFSDFCECEVCICCVWWVFFSWEYNVDENAWFPGFVYIDSTDLNFVTLGVGVEGGLQNS